MSDRTITQADLDIEIENIEEFIEPKSSIKDSMQRSYQAGIEVGWAAACAQISDYLIKHHDINIAAELLKMAIECGSNKEGQ